MNNELEKNTCPICKDDICSCNNTDNTKEKSVAVKRNVTINFDKNCDCEKECTCEGECSCENKKNALAVLGATVVAVGVAGGILYLVKNKK